MVKHTPKKTPKKSLKKKKTSNYSPKKLQKALDEISSGTSHVIAARKYDIPRTTLISKSTGARPKTYTRPGPKPLLGEDIENRISDWLLDCAKKGFPITKNGLQFTIRKILEENPDIKLDKRSSLRKWTQGFFDRHLKLQLRVSEYLHGGRACASEAKIRKWFQELKDTLGDQVNIFKDPARVFNSDETAIYLNPKGGPVIAEKGQRCVYNVGQNNKENVTVLVTANANGDIAPPLALYSFSRIPTAIQKFAPGYWGIGRSPSGWMNAECFFEYMTNVFLKFLNDSKIPKPIVFIVDGHKSHLSLQVSEFCKKEQIHLISLPSNCTHILQPLDVSFFAPLKSQWKRYLETYKLQHKVNMVEKHDVAVLLDDVLQNSDFVQTLKNGFKACGLVPFNVEAVDYSKIVQKEPEPVEEPISISNNQSEKSVEFLKEFESRLPQSTLDDFLNCHLTHELPENKGLHALFQLWRDCLVEITPPVQIQDEDDIQCGVFEIMQGGEVAPVVDCSEEVPSSVDSLSNVHLADEVFNCPSKNVGKLPDGDSIGEFSSENDLLLHTDDIRPGSVLQNSSVMSVDKLDHLPETNSFTVEGDEPIQSSSPKIVITDEPIQSNSPKNVIADEPVQSNSAKNVITDESIQSNQPKNDILHANSSPTDCDEIYNRFVLNHPKSADHISEMRTPLLAKNSLLRHAKSADNISENRKRSVSEILNSLTLFKTRVKPSEEQTICRKKLVLPSVVTCDKWIELQRAKEQEQLELELQKEERKKLALEKRQAKEMDQKTRLEKKADLKRKREIENEAEDLKKSKTMLPKPEKLRKPQKNESTFKKKDKKVHESHDSPAEVKLKDWVVVNFKMGRLKQKFIGQIEGAENGMLKANFLRPADTRENHGFMYRFPKVEDKTFFNYNQIEKIVYPETSRRGLLHFPTERHVI